MTAIFEGFCLSKKSQKEVGKVEQKKQVSYARNKIEVENVKEEVFDARNEVDLLVVCVVLHENTTPNFVQDGEQVPREANVRGENESYEEDVWVEKENPILPPLKFVCIDS